MPRPSRDGLHTQVAGMLHMCIHTCIYLRKSILDIWTRDGGAHARTNVYTVTKIGRNHIYIKSDRSVAAAQGHRLGHSLRDLCPLLPRHGGLQPRRSRGQQRPGGRVCRRQPENLHGKKKDESVRQSYQSPVISHHYLYRSAISHQSSVVASHVAAPHLLVVL